MAFHVPLRKYSITIADAAFSAVRFWQLYCTSYAVRSAFLATATVLVNFKTCLLYRYSLWQLGADRDDEPIPTACQRQNVQSEDS